MTFTELKQAVKDRLNLSSTEADTRIGIEINDRYRRLTSSLGINTTARTSVSANSTIGVTTLTFSGIEHITNVMDRSVSPYRMLREVTVEELRVHQPFAKDTPDEYAILLVGSSSVTILMDCTPTAPFTLWADGTTTRSDLSGSDVPAFPASFHDILKHGALADEYRKMEKVRLAEDAEMQYERRLSDLRMFLFKSAYKDLYQGKTESLPIASGGGSGSGGGAGVAALSWTQYGLITFDRTAEAPGSRYPFAVVAGSEKVANLDADKLDGETGADYHNAAKLTNTGVYNVKGYGAVGDGVANDTTAVQAAIDAAAITGGVVYFPVGIYKCNTLTWNENVRLLGDMSTTGPGGAYSATGGSIIRSRAAETLLSYLPVSFKPFNGTIEQITLDGDGVGTVGLDVQNTAWLKMSRCLVRKFSTAGVRIGGSSSFSILIDQMTHIRECGVGVKITSTGTTTNHVILRDSAILGNTTYGIQASNVSLFELLSCVIEQNGTTSDTGTGGAIFSGCGSTNQVVGLIVDGCWFEANQGHSHLRINEPSTNNVVHVVQNSLFWGGGAVAMNYALAVMGGATYNTLLTVTSVTTVGIAVAGIYEATTNIFSKYVGCYSSTSFAGTTRVEIPDSATQTHLYLGYGQLRFPATQVPSTNVNTLDDYEEGTWTPVIGGSGGTSGQAYSYQLGNYTKIGRLVVASFSVQLSTLGTVTGNAEIQGLPFTIGAVGSGYMAYWINMTTNWIALGLTGNSGTAMTLFGRNSAGTSISSLASGDLSNTTQLLGTVMYAV